jgi:hypothetical protein
MMRKRYLRRAGTNRISGQLTAAYGLQRTAVQQLKAASAKQKAKRLRVLKFKGPTS